MFFLFSRIARLYSSTFARNIRSYSNFPFLNSSQSERNRWKVLSFQGVSSQFRNFTVFVHNMFVVFSCFNLSITPRTGAVVCERENVLSPFPFSMMEINKINYLCDSGFAGERGGMGKSSEYRMHPVPCEHLWNFLICAYGNIRLSGQCTHWTLV